MVVANVCQWGMEKSWTSDTASMELTDYMFFLVVFAFQHILVSAGDDSKKKNMLLSSKNNVFSGGCLSVSKKDVIGLKKTF